MIKHKWFRRLSDIFGKSRLSRNTGQKLISLLFAILFWLYVMDQVNPEMVKQLENVKIDLLNASSVTQNGLVIMNEEDFFVNVKIKGRRNDLFEITNEDVRVTADLSGYGKGLNSVPLETKTFNGSFVVSDLSQKDIKVTLDKVVDISKPVNMIVVGETSSGYVKGELKYTPLEITVRGPESYVNTVAMVYGEMKVEGATTTIEKEIPVIPVDNDGNVVSGVELGRDYVRASIDVEKLKTLAVNERLSGQPANGYKIVKVQIDPAAVTVKGSEADIDILDRLYTMPMDISGIMGTSDVEVQLDLPEGITAPYLYVPAVATIYVEPYVTKTFEVKGTDIPIRNMDSAFIVTQSDIPGKVKITVRDIESVMDDFTLDNLTLYYDGTSLKPGIANKAVVEFETPSPVKYVEIEAGTVRIPVRLKELINEGTNSNGSQSGTGQPSSGENQGGNSGSGNSNNSNNGNSNGNSNSNNGQ